MAFVGVCKAIYDYSPAGDGELAIKEGDVLYILEKSTEDDWWKAKKRAASEDEDEPEGLVPNNYVEEASPIGKAKALYDYSRQTDEELSISEEAVLNIYDTSDPDWTLVGLDGEFGFVPANYIEETTAEAAPAKPPRPSQTLTPQPELEETYNAVPAQSPAAAIAGLIQQKTGTTAPAPAREPTPEASDEEPPPSLPQRPRSQGPTSPEPAGVMASPPLRQEGPRSPGGYHLYNIHEMISHMGKNKKMPTTLGINVGSGVIMIAPEKSRDGPQKEWAADQLTHYSIEGKHVFMELVRPSRSIDFHAGAKDTAEEIVAQLGEMAGAARAGGLREVIAAGQGTGEKRGRMRFEFMAQGDDEVTVAEGDDVVILDDVASDEWWQVRRLKNGKEGAVPASYVEITDVAIAPASMPVVPSGGSTVQKNRQEEERATREAVASRKKEEPLPDRYSSLNASRSVRETRSENRTQRSSSDAKPKPNPAKVRLWTDRTGSFKVEAEFLGLKDNKIHIHKLNGVKIAVALSKMSLGDIEYVEKVTGLSLEDEKPLSDIKRRGTQRSSGRETREARETREEPAKTRSGATIQTPQPPKYDWFDFFLQCGVNPQICERYSSSFERDQMGEENLVDIQPSLLRTLGLKEGDILRVMKFLDNKFNRTPAPVETNATGSGGLFTTPSGDLKVPKKGRPAPAVANTNTVDPRAFEQESLQEGGSSSPAPTKPQRPTAATTTSSGFDDDAWNIKPSPTTSGPVRVASPPTNTPAPKPAVSRDLVGISLLDEPLVPTKAAPAPAPAAPAPQPQIQAAPIQAQPTANSAFFDQLAQSRPTSQAGTRQRPLPPQQMSQTNGLIAPPPQRPMSAPQNQSAFAPPPLQAQLTGYQPQPQGPPPQLAPPGQSLSELNQQRMMPQMTGYGFGQPNGMIAQPTGFPGPMQNGYPQFPQASFQYQQPQMQPQQQFQQQPQFLQSQMTSSPFADPPRAPFQAIQPQQTSYGQMMPQQTGINNFLPPALQPQRTGPANGFVPQQTGFGQQPNGFGQPSMPQQQSFSPPPMPPMPQQQTPAPLVAQKTGPAPPVRFGMSDAKPLVPQPTGRANLAKATPQNPFGF